MSEIRHRWTDTWILSLQRGTARVLGRGKERARKERGGGPDRKRR